MVFGKMGENKIKEWLILAGILIIYILYALKYKPSFMQIIMILNIMLFGYLLLVWFMIKGFKLPCIRKKGIKMTKEEQLKKYRKVRRLLDDIGGEFRCADKHFSEFEWEDKMMFNKVGKIIEWVSQLLLTYDYGNEDKKREIRRIFGIVEGYIEKMNVENKTLRKKIIEDIKDFQNHILGKINARITISPEKGDLKGDKETVRLVKDISEMVNTEIEKLKQKINERFENEE